jgi:hypothetical protein
MKNNNSRPPPPLSLSIAAPPHGPCLHRSDDSLAGESNIQEALRADCQDSRIESRGDIVSEWIMDFQKMYGEGLE